MKAYFQPLFIFVGGNIFLLFLFLFFPAFASVQTGLEADIVAEAPNFWGLSWVITSMRVMIILVVEGTILFAVAKSFLGINR